MGRRLTRIRDGMEATRGLPRQIAAGEIFVLRYRRIYVFGLIEERRRKGRSSLLLQFGYWWTRGRRRNKSRAWANACPKLRVCFEVDYQFGLETYIGDSVQNDFALYR